MPDSAASKWSVFFAVGLPIFMGTVDGSIVNIALPRLVTAFGTDFAAVQWVALAYLLVLTTLVPSLGRLGDMYGKKRPFLLGLGLFTLASWLCGLSTSLPGLLAARVLQGCGAAATNALGAALITEAFPAQQRGKAMGGIGAVVSTGVIVGPSLGGLLLSVASWQWIFFVNLPIGVLAAYLVWRRVPADKPRGAQHFDLAGGVLLVSLLSALLLAVTLGQRLGLGHPAILGMLAYFGLALPTFIAWQKRCAQPTVDMSLFANPAFGGHLTAGFLLFVCMSGLIVLIPFYLQGVRGLSIRQTGLLMAVTPTLIAVLAPLAGNLSDRFGSAAVTRVGLVLAVGGLASVSTLGSDTPIAGYLARFLLLGCGMALFQAPNNSAIMGSAPAHRLGTASALMTLSRTMGQMVGQGLLGSFWAWRTTERDPSALGGGASYAHAAAQVAGLQDTARVAVALLLGALLINLRSHRRDAVGRLT